eukprot:s2296_g4.t1
MRGWRTSSAILADTSSVLLSRRKDYAVEWVIMRISQAFNELLNLFRKDGLGRQGKVEARGGKGAPGRQVTSVSTQTQDWPLNGDASPTKSLGSSHPDVASWQSQVRSLREALMRLEGDMAGNQSQEATAFLHRKAENQEGPTRVDDLFASRCCSPARRTPERLQADLGSKHSRV